MSILRRCMFILVTAVIVAAGARIMYRLIYENHRTNEVRAIAETIDATATLEDVQGKLARMRDLGAQVTVFKMVIPPGPEAHDCVKIISARGYNHFMKIIPLRTGR